MYIVYELRMVGKGLCNSISITMASEVPNHTAYATLGLYKYTWKIQSWIVETFFRNCVQKTSVSFLFDHRFVYLFFSLSLYFEWGSSD